MDTVILSSYDPILVGAAEGLASRWISLRPGQRQAVSISQTAIDRPPPQCLGCGMPECEALWTLRISLLGILAYSPGIQSSSDAMLTGVT